MKTLQHFTPEYLGRCKDMSPSEIAKFLEDFRMLHGASDKPSKSKLISLKVPEDLLATFRAKANLYQTPYQTQIKRLMKQWVENL